MYLDSIFFTSLCLNTSLSFNWIIPIPSVLLNLFNANFRDKGLEFIVVDGNSELLKDLRKDSTKFDYLEKVFDYNKIDENNEFSIFKIDYDLFDLRTWLSIVR